LEVSDHGDSQGSGAAFSEKSLAFAAVEGFSEFFTHPMNLFL
jgi:hypothetical protein